MNMLHTQFVVAAYQILIYVDVKISTPPSTNEHVLIMFAPMCPSNGKYVTHYWTQVKILKFFKLGIGQVSLGSSFWLVSCHISCVWRIFHWVIFLDAISPSSNGLSTSMKLYLSEYQKASQTNINCLSWIWLCYRWSDVLLWCMCLIYSQQWSIFFMYFLAFLWLSNWWVYVKHFQGKYGWCFTLLGT